MNKIDSFFDTFEKRVMWGFLGYTLAALIVSSMIIALGIQLLQVNDYQKITVLLDYPGLDELLFGRLAIACLSMPVLDLKGLFWQIVQFRWFEIIFIIGSLLIWNNSPSIPLEKNAKQSVKIQIICCFILCLSVLLGFGMGFQAGSLEEIISILHGLGMGCCICGGLMIVMNGLSGAQIIQEIPTIF